MLLKKIIVLVLLTVIVCTGCEKAEDKPVHVEVLPPVKGLKFDYNGYATNPEFELKSGINIFTRLFFEKDTINGQPMNVYLSKGKRVPYYTNEKGDVWEQQTEDISAQLLANGLKTDDKIVLKYWKQLLKISKGKKSKWDVLVDTTFYASDADGKKQKIQYYHYGEAYYEGWSQVTVQQRRTIPYRCMTAYWPVVNTFIINHTTGDSIFVSKGNARQVFEPTYGVIKYMVDYTLKEFGKEPVESRGTWELVVAYIPKQN